MDIQRIISLVKETKGIITNREMAARVKEKGVADYVTQVDVAVQDFLKKELYMLAPDIQFLGEETGLQRMNTDCYWILDPVDGTTNLMHDYQHSVVSLALCFFRKEAPGNHNRCRYGQKRAGGRELRQVSQSL